MIYVHVPLCKSFCTYCDFYSEITSKTREDAFTKEVCAEILRRRGEMDRTLHTLYFGGGTPSLLSLQNLTRILLSLEEAGMGGPYTEFTMEANPDDIVAMGPGYIRSLASLGVNRISVGVQSLDDGMLRWMNRRHDAAAAVKAVEIVREGGIENISIDLIFGFSNLSDEVWEDTVRKAIDLRPAHISCYQLSVEGGSKLAEMVEDGLYEEASDEACRRQYDHLASALSAAGYDHYEISNFALPGFRAKHNSGYWARQPYVGLGPSAHSFTGTSRKWNSHQISGYTSTSEELSDEDIRVERIMLSLRTADGIAEKDLLHLTRKEDVDRLVSEGALKRRAARIRIPEDRFFVSDEIIRELI